MATVIVSGIVAWPWDRFQFGQVTGWPFLQSLLHFCPYTSFSQVQCWLEYFVGGLLSLSLHRQYCLATRGGHFRFDITTVGVFQLRSSTLSPGRLSHLISLGLPRNFSQSPPLAAAYFLSFFCPSGPLSCLFHTWSCPSIPVLLPSTTLFPSSLPVAAQPAACKERFI